ncbi:MAG TPA: hypothetical protein VM582_03800, partial [Candidatus Thermoplasmatota archaeon]|nr:hypothetical protein [Candidatus Thermoplasmatota archaeon]
IVSAWFNDPLLDDGFVNATLQLADLGAAEDAAHARRYELDWTLRSDRFRVRWTVTNETTATLWRETGGRQKPLIELPVETDRANGTLTSSIPLRLIGQPRAGDVFTDLRANASRHVAAFGLAPSDYQQADGLGDPGVVDEAAQTVRPFRLRGGSDLEEAPRDEPLVFEPSPPAEALDATGVASASAAVPWYQAPFAADNLPNTLQVAGAMAAVLTFLAGLLLLARRRSLVQKLVDAVEAARRENEGDAEKLAAAVRAVEARAHDLAARGRLDAREFALVTRRIDQALRRS